MKKKLGKRFLALVLAALMLAAVSVPAAAARTFSDVRGSRWSYKAIEYAYATGSMNGIGGGAFNPGGTVSRAMVAQVLWNKSGKPASTMENPFEDVGEGIWYEAPIVWCKENGIINGVAETLFAPDRAVARQDVCVMVYNYLKAAAGGVMEPADGAAMSRFEDAGAVSSYAEEAVRWAVQSGFMSGSGGMLKPKGSATREELAQFLLNLDKIQGVDTDIELPVDDEPEPPPFSEPVRISQNAGGVYVSGVAFNPQMGYNAKVVLGNDRLRSAESWSSIVSRSGAYVAVNGAFFESGGDLTTYSTLVNNGEPVRFDNDGCPAQPVFVIDKNGKASIEHFSIIMTTKQYRDGEDITPVVIHALKNINLRQNDEWGTKVIFTREYGSTVPVTVLNAVAVDANGTVTAKYQNQGDVPIPTSGYVMAEVSVVSQYDHFLEEVQVGDTLKQEVEYVGSSTQDIALALSCGPTVVKDGQAYGNAETYAQEGQGAIKRGNLARMAIGVKADGTVVIINATCDVPALGSAMAALGCQEAMNLDGGASTLLYVAGGAVVTPGRNLSNVLVFTKAQ